VFCRVGFGCKKAGDLSDFLLSKVVEI